jgi:hypothetical protein
MNPVPQSSRFFFNSGPKKVQLSLSLNVKCDQQTHKKMMPPIYGINLKKKSNKVPIIIFRCIMGDEPIIIEQFFYGFEGLLWVSIMGSQNSMSSDYGSNISEGMYLFGVVIKLGYIGSSLFRNYSFSLYRILAL